MKKILTSNGKPLVKDGKVFLSDGGSSVIEVDTLPTNPEKNVIYQVNEISDIDVYVKTGANSPSTLEEAIKYLGLTPNLTFYVVDSLPSSPNISNLQTFSPAYVYIYDDIAYTYGNAGYGNMWLGVKDLVSQAMNLQYKDKGYVESIDKITQNGNGIYVTYKLGKQGIYIEKYILFQNNGGWIDYKSIFDKTITSIKNSSIYEVPCYAFYNCENLISVDLPNVINIRGMAFSACYNLKTLKLAKVESLSDPFHQCTNITDIYLGYEGVVDLITPLGTPMLNYLNKAKIHVPSSQLNAYQSNERWQLEVSEGNVILVGDYTD